MTEVLVAGGGIAGTVAAMALQRAGYRPTVYEAYPSGGEDAGAFLTVGPNGMLALDQIGVREPVIEAGFPITALDLADDRGRRIAKVPIGGPSSTMAGYHNMRRADLYRVLQREAENKGIPVRHGKRLADASVHDQGVTVTFTDGSRADGDMLVGADGLRSTVRGCVGPANGPVYSGELVFYGYAPDAGPPFERDALHMIRGKKTAFGYIVAPDGETWWFLRVPGRQLSRERLAGTTPGQWRAELLELVRRDRTPAADILRATQERLLAANVWELAEGSTWRRGPMIVVGDAAHAASPASAQGASLAMEDGVMLAKALRDLPDREQAFAAYEQLRRARVNRVVDGARLRNQPKPVSWPRRVLRNRLAKRRLGNRLADSRNWLYDYPVDWETKITAELAAEVAAAQQPT
jgi:2-polyprenyl-6-methoxyphenol hydroxylase-like FAD-dependent oxidoreductase